MKWDCDESESEAARKSTENSRRVAEYHRKAAAFRTANSRMFQWHPWFAWRPIRLSQHDCRWLEWVERRMEYDDLFWFRFDYFIGGEHEYRAAR